MEPGLIRKEFPCPAVGGRGTKGLSRFQKDIAG